MRVVRPVFHWGSLVHGRSFIRAVLHESGEASLSLRQSCTWKVFYEGSFT